MGVSKELVDILFSILILLLLFFLVNLQKAMPQFLGGGAIRKSFRAEHFFGSKILTRLTGPIIEILKFKNDINRYYINQIKACMLY